ncbi:MAG: hypothetical protein Q8O92_12220 [Candidatus Latescibacter sp.]|nr:hypothetical protein [Candidatus Latescibacter sp.]
MAQIIDRNVIEFCRSFWEPYKTQMQRYPKELSNTIANVFYRQSELICYTMQRKEYLLFEKYGKGNFDNSKSNDLLQNVEIWAKLTAEISTDFETIKKMIDAMKEIDQYEQPNAFNEVKDVILDMFKYKMDTKYVMSTPFIIRYFKRFSRKKYIDEIPDLIDKL